MPSQEDEVGEERFPCFLSRLPSGDKDAFLTWRFVSVTSLYCPSWSGLTVSVGCGAGADCCSGATERDEVVVSSV